MDSGAGAVNVAVLMTINRRTKLLIALLGVTLAITLAACRRETVRLHFVIPDGYVGVLKLRAERPDGVEPVRSNRVIMLPFSTNGTCDVRGPLPTLQWHQLAARYANGPSLNCFQGPGEVPESAFGLRGLGVKQNVESWYLLGTGKELPAAMEQFYGFPVPRR